MTTVSDAKEVHNDRVLLPTWEGISATMVGWSLYNISLPKKDKEC